MGSDNAKFLDLNEYPLYRQLARKLATRRLSEVIRWVVILLIFLYLLKIYLDFSPSYVIDKNFANGVPGPSSSNLLANVCSTETKLCYGVLDYAIDEQGLVVNRALYVKGFEKEVDTLVRLLPPQNGLTFHDSDSKLWQINHMNLSTQYTAILCLFPFVLGSVPSLENNKDTAMIMNVGLGGGTVDMFLHQLKPLWKIHVYELDPLVKKLSHEWFGVVDDTNRKTFLKDGLVAIKEAVEQETKYDVILIDACDNDKLMPCPAKDFLKTEHIKNMKAILRPTGCVLFNILVLEDNHIDERVKMAEHGLLMHFPTCVIIRMNMEFNVVIACVPYSLEPSTAAQTKEMWRENLDKIVAKFNFNFDTS